MKKDIVLNLHPYGPSYGRSNGIWWAEDEDGDRVAASDESDAARKCQDTDTVLRWIDGGRQ